MIVVACKSRLRNTTLEHPGTLGRGRAQSQWPAGAREPDGERTGSRTSNRDESLEFTVWRSAFQRQTGTARHEGLDELRSPLPFPSPSHAERKTPNGRLRTFIPAARSGGPPPF